MPRFRVLAALALGSALVTAGFASGASAASDPPTPRQWAKGVCSSLETWIGDVDDVISSLGSENSLEDAINAAADGIRDATNELVTSLDDLGLPQTKNARQARRALDTLGTQLDRDANRIRRSLEDLGNDPVDIASTFADIGTVVQRAIDQVQAAGDTLQGLDRNGALRKALERSPACKSLEQAI